MTPGGLANLASRGRWVSARHLTLLNERLLAVARGELRRLIVCMPPRHGKSMLLSQYFPAWYLGTFPERRVLLASYEASFAASWGRKARDVLEEFGAGVFGVQLRSDSQAADRWDLAGHEGGMMTAGVGGALTGKGAHLLIIDDPLKNAEEAQSPTIRTKLLEWFRSTAYTRLEPGGAAILIQTRWNLHDLAGSVIEEVADGGERWEVLNLPAVAEENDPLGRQPGEALWPARYPVEQLQTIQRTLGPYWWSALYMGSPGPEGGTEFPAAWFGPGIWFENWPKDITTRVIALDPSKGKDAKFGDYAAFVCLGRDKEGTLWCEAELVRKPPTQLVEIGLELYRRFRADAFTVEVNQFQELLAFEFIRAARLAGLTLPMVTIENTVNKEMRIRRLGHYLANGLIRFKGGSPATKLLVQQLQEFPVGEHDDGPDSLEMGLRTMLDLINGRGGDRVIGRIA